MALATLPFDPVEGRFASALAVIGPYWVAGAEAYVPGADAIEVHVPGTAAGEVHLPGAAAVEVRN